MHGQAHAFAPHSLLRLGVCLALLIGVGTTSAAPWGDLSSWVGAYPTDQSTSPPRRLLSMPAIQLQLRKVLQPADLSRLSSYRVEQPVQRVDGFLVVMQCMPHDCGDHSAMVVIDLDQARIWVAFFSRKPGAVSTQWFGSTEHPTLPESVRKLFESSHQP